MINLIRKIFGKKKEEIRQELPHVEMKIKDRQKVDTGSITSSVKEEKNPEWMHSTSKPNPDWGRGTMGISGTLGPSGRGGRNESREERKKREFEENKKAIKKEMEMLFSQTPVGQTYESIKHIKKVFGKSIPPPPPIKRNGPKKASH
jgi:hypothetical protein